MHSCAKGRGCGRRLGGIAFLVCVALPGRAQTKEQPEVKPERPSFEVASIKVNRSGDTRIYVNPATGDQFRVTNLRLLDLISMAYGLRLDQVVDAPVWAGSERYDVEAKAEHPIEHGDWQPKLEALLVDRFHLQSHWETRDRASYELVLTKLGKLREAGPCTPFVPGTPLPPGKISPGPCGGYHASRGQMIARDVSMKTFSRGLTFVLETDVADKTGLEGKYDIDLEWAPESPVAASDASPFPFAEPERPPLFTALQEELGLKLISRKAPVKVLVIDSVARLSEN